MNRTAVVVLTAIVMCGGSSPMVSAQATPDPGLRSVEINKDGRQLGLIWHTRIVPGEEILVIQEANERYQTTFFSRYRFAGIIGDSLHVDTRTAIQILGQTSAEESEVERLYVERGSDGAFYFVPQELKEIGTLRIANSRQEPGFYFVSLSRHDQ